MFSIKPLFDPIRHRSNIENYIMHCEPFNRIKADVHMRRSFTSFKIIDGEIIYPPFSESEQKLLDQCDEMIDYYSTKFNLGNETC